MAMFYVERQPWQHWPKKLVVVRKVDGEGKDERRWYVPERTCRVERRHVGPLYNVYKFSCCEEEWAESNTDQHASAIDETVCPRCGARVKEG